VRTGGKLRKVWLSVGLGPTDGVGETDSTAPVTLAPGLYGSRGRWIRVVNQVGILSSANGISPSARCPGRSSGRGPSPAMPPAVSSPTLQRVPAPTLPPNATQDLGAIGAARPKKKPQDPLTNSPPQVEDTNAALRCSVHRDRSRHQDAGRHVSFLERLKCLR